METIQIHITLDLTVYHKALHDDFKNRKCFMPQDHRFFTIFGAVELRPPIYDEMVGDMGNIINRVVAGYVDQSCMELHYEDLVADCWAKTSDMIHKGLLLRCRTRAEFFKQYKTAILNHIRSLVQKHRFTEKRTGIKPPPKDQRYSPTAISTKPCEVRIDDPDSGFQISDLAAECDSQIFRELLEEVRSRLDRQELPVFDELVSPSVGALELAKQDAERGRKHDEPMRIRITHEHLAQSIGKEMTPELFQTLHDSIKSKCLFMKTRQEDDPRQTAAMATLLQFFGIQLPRSMAEIVHKRALLLAAQHQYDRLKDNEGIKEALKTCGIPLPEVRNDRHKCFGVMFQKFHRICSNCGMQEACETKAANFGIGEITISHKLLGARHNRVPLIPPTRSSQETAITESVRDEEILSFLDESFKPVSHQGQACYRHKDRLATEGMQFIFSIGKQLSPLRLRFINPGEELKPSLKHESGDKGGPPAWYLPDALTADEALNLIRAHAQMTFTQG